MKRKSLVLISLFVLLLTIVIVALIWTLNQVGSMIGESKSTLLGVLLGGLIAAFVSIVSEIVRYAAGEARARREFSQEISRQAMELAKHDNEVRWKSSQPAILAPAKSWRTLYTALKEYVETDNWSRDVERHGLLSIIVKGESDNNTP